MSSGSVSQLSPCGAATLGRGTTRTSVSWLSAPGANRTATPSSVVTVPPRSALTWTAVTGERSDHTTTPPTASNTAATTAARATRTNLLLGPGGPTVGRALKCG